MKFCGISSQNKEKLMLDLHPDKFEVIWSRILLVAHGEPALRSTVDKAIKTRFLKEYTKSEYEAAFSKLELHGLIELLSTTTGTKIYVTRKGSEHVGMIEYLSLSQPDPYHKLTRPSYSPNCMSASGTTVHEEDMFVPAPANWSNPAPLETKTW